MDRRNSNGDKAGQDKVKRTKEIDREKSRADKLQAKQQKKVDRERQKASKKSDKEEAKKRKKIDKEEKKKNRLAAQEMAKKPPSCGGRVIGGRCICSNGSVADRTGRCAVVASIAPPVNTCPAGQIMRGGICALQNRNSCGALDAQLQRKGLDLFELQIKKRDACFKDPASALCGQLTNEVAMLENEIQGLKLEDNNCNQQTALAP